MICQGQVMFVYYCMKVERKKKKRKGIVEVAVVVEEKDIIVWS